MMTVARSRVSILIAVILRNQAGDVNHTLAGHGGEVAGKAVRNCDFASVFSSSASDAVQALGKPTCLFKSLCLG